MSELIQKSSENFDAIDKLIEQNLKAPVIHCAYYSSLQLIIHYSYEYSKLTEEEALREVKSKGSHLFYLNIYVKEIRKINARNASQFYKFFTNFKRKRTEADYYNTQIFESDLKQAKKFAQVIREFIRLIHDEGKCENIYNIKA
ncbi:hypothetical protein [Tangfeifania diversioriginum]|uniref:hypothetical protein n=1 Tax=Tangfeifania diversioriginum TaxID=1168035 RepID=UPI000933A12E|nr:hypothetical protein [Tangfeifania diversioriginum]